MTVTESSIQTYCKSMGHHLKGDVLVLIQEHFCLADTDVQVIIGEFVGNVKPQRAKLSSL